MATYKSGVKSFKTFLLLNNIANNVKMLPELSENVFLQYIAYCYNTLQIKHSTIKLYLSGIRLEYLKEGTLCPLLKTDNPSYLRITALLNAVKRIQGKNKRLRLPITGGVLKQMCSVLHHGYTSPYTDSLLAAAFISCYCGFLRCGEITVSQNKFDPHRNLCLNDVVFFETHMELYLKSSKTDPFRQGVCISLFKNDASSSLCPLDALSQYLELRNKYFPDKITADSPFFLTESGEPMCRSYFVLHVKSILAQLGYDTSSYNSHSFRIGASTTAASCRLEDHLIRTLGRWSSDCYRTYIHTPQQVLKSAQNAILQAL